MGERWRGWGWRDKLVGEWWRGWGWRDKLMGERWREKGIWTPTLGSILFVFFQNVHNYLLKLMTFVWYNVWL